MKNYIEIDKKVGSPYPLKYFFDPASHEYGSITIEQKFDYFRAVVSSGYSTYDLSEKFRRDRSDRYSHENMHHVLRSYISKLIFNDYHNPYVQKYYEETTDATVAKDLDNYLVNPSTEEDFMKKISLKFNIALD